MDISIIGSGYVGLVTGACFADVGHHVICVDNDAEKSKQLKAGEIPIYEPGLEEIIHRNVSARAAPFHRQHSGSRREFTNHLYRRSDPATARWRRRSQLRGESCAGNRRRVDRLSRDR